MVIILTSNASYNKAPTNVGWRKGEAMGTIDILQAIGNSIQIFREGPIQVEAGTPVNVKLVPDRLPDLTVPVIASGNLNVTWLTKSVRFQDALLEVVPVDDHGNPTMSLADVLTKYLADPTKVIGGMPIPEIQIPIDAPPMKGAIPPTTDIGIAITTATGLAQPPVVSSNPTPNPNQLAALPPLPTVAPNSPSPSDLLSGVPGLLGQLAASVPIPTLAPLTLTIAWKVTKADGTVLIVGSDYLAPHGLTLQAIDFIFNADFVELTADSAPKTTTLCIGADVTLSAGGITTPTIHVQPVPVIVPQIGLPTVLATFRHANFMPADGDNPGWVFVMVPENSKFSTLNELAPVITHLQTLVGSLTAFANNVGFLLGLDQITNALNAQTFVQFRAANEIDDLEKIVMQSGHWYNFLGTGPFFDMDADDAISSLILIGVEGKNVKLFNDNLDDGDGAFTVIIGSDRYATVRYLDGTIPAVEPASSIVHVDVIPPGGLFEPDKFNDEVSSIRFL
jgi:hypothetical protein